jgi:PST family polysaccharide transporter
LAWTVVHLVSAWLLVERVGLNGAGIAFFLSYVFHIVLIYAIVRTQSGFRWSAENKRTGLLFISLIAAVFCSSHLLPSGPATGIGSVAVLLSGVYSVRVLAFCCK